MNRDEKLKKIIEEIKNDEENKKYTEQGIDPLFSAPEKARIVIVGQAPGLKAQENRLYWKDKSGDKLRIWTGIDEKTFYSSNLLAKYLWIFIIQEKEKVVIYLQEKILEINGIIKF